jgi:hypothetical protein
MLFSKKIVFPHKHPLFKKYKTIRGVHYENSIYYYWFEFLKLNEKYITACKNKGRGMKKIYEDFGDIRNKTFRQWWNEKYKGITRGVYLFASTNPFNQLININSQTQYNQINQSDYTVIAVPKLIDKKYAVQQVRKLTQNNKKFNYEAKYKFESKTFKIETLKKNLKYLKSKKLFNVNWKAVAVAHDKSTEKVSSAGRIYFNQLANRCERQIKFFYKNIIK